MIALMLLGVGAGLGLWALVVWLIPPRPPLAALVSRLNTAPAPPPILTANTGGWAVRLGSPFTGLLRAAATRPAARSARTSPSPNGRPKRTWRRRPRSH